jgi:hypothetical protein
MFTKKEQSKLDREIESLLDSMDSVSRIPKFKEFYDEKKDKYYYERFDEYTPMVDNLKKLYEAKSSTYSENIDPKTVMIVVGNLLGIIMILKHEKFNVVTSKALGFVLRGRV